MSRVPIVWLLEASPRNPATGAVVTVRLAGGGIQGYRQFSQTDWRAGLERPPAFVQRLGFDDGAYGDGGVPQATELRWGGTAKRASALAALYWPDATFTLRSGPDGGADSAFAVIMTGRFADVVSEPARLTLRMADPGVILARPVLAGATFKGDGGIEGIAELKGRPKRRGVGRCRNVELWSLDPANNIWVATDPALKLFAIDQVYDRGNAASAVVQVAWAGSIAATLAALAATACPAGGAAAAPSIACIKWWFAQPGKLTCDLRGEIGAGYIDRPADIAAWAVAAVGGPVVNAASLVAARALRNDEAGLLVSDEASAATAITDVLSGVSLWWGMTAAGEMEFGPWAFGASGGAIVAASVKRIKTHRPVKKVTVGYRRNNHVMARGDIAAVVLDAAYADGTPIDDLRPATAGATRNVNRGNWSAAGVAYSLGDIVQRGGSSYAVEVAHISAAGNGPPGANWSLFAAAGLDGSDGTPGQAGGDGNTSYIHFAYANSANGVTDFTTGAANGRFYIGTYTDFTAADSNNPAVYTWSLFRGSDGNNGTPGAPGADGQATYVHIAYATSATGSTGFSTTDGAGKTYIGTYTDGVLADSTNPALYTWSLIKGERGEPGLDGDGIPGTPGANGQTSYVHFAYANSANGVTDFTTGDAGGRYYVGTYTDFTAADSTNPAVYTWSLFRGADGANGTPGANGANGQATYVHIAYATAADGSTGFSTTDGAGRTYIGTYTDGILADSTNPAAYTWSLIKGVDGANGISPVAAVAIPANKQFTADSGGTVKTGQLPFNVAVTGTKTGASISGTVTIIGAPTGCTAAAIANGFTINTVFADAGFVEWRFTASDGQIVENKMSFSRQRDPASGGAVLVNFTSDTWFGSGSYAASGPSTVLPASATGKLRISGYASFYTAAASGSATITAKLQYRAVGSGIWIDSSFSATGISTKLTGVPGEPDENNPGDVGPTGLLTGLTANGSYEVQMVGTRSGATANNSSGFVSLMQEA